ncbi:MAG: response regulator [Butyrivibrio sp.]|nr:response regulator [Butyrivibrio sp.]
MQKIKKRGFIIPIIGILFFVGIILVYYRMLYDEKKENIIKDGEVTAQKSADLIDMYITSNMDEISLAAYALDEMITKKRSDEDVYDFLVRQSDAIRSAVDEDTTGIYGYINGKFYSGTKWIPPKDYDATERPWYIKAISRPGEITLLDPYLDMQSGQHMMAIGKVLIDGESVVSMDMSISGIQQIVDETVGSGEADIGIVISDENLVIAHSDRSEVGRDYDVQRGSLGEAIVHNLANKDKDYFEFKYAGEDYIVYTATIKSGLCCISVKNVSNVFGSMRWVLIFTIAVVIISIIIITYLVRFYIFQSDGVEAHENASAGSSENDAKEEKKQKDNAVDFNVSARSSDAFTKRVPARAFSKYSGPEASYIYRTDKKSTTIGKRILWLVLIVLFVSGALFCIVSIIQSRAAIRSSVCQRMIDIANCAAGSVDGNIHKNLTAEDVDSPEYMQVYNALAVYRDNVELEYVYAIKVEDDGRFTYTVDPSVDEPEEFGDEIEYSDGLYSASMGVASVDDFRASDEWGTFYSSYSPIFDSKGNIAGIVGVDFSVDWFEGQLNEQTNSMVRLYIIVLVVTIAFAWILSFIWIRSITEPLGYMTEVARQYGEGDFSESIDIDSNDEIGVLSHTLQVMAVSLQEQVQRAEAANHAKSTFLANMSHEIRTPINAVLGMNEMILRESEDNTIQYYAQNIKSAGRNLLSLINDILDFSKIEAGKTEVTPVDYNLAILLNDLLVIIQSRVYDKGLTLNISFDPTIPRGLYGDEVRIRQIIINLLTNALKYTREGSITFTVSWKKDEKTKDMICLDVSVADTGIGIRKEDMDKLFYKFERLDEKKNRNIEGTGLGLNITRSLLELMDSELKVSSEYGKGSVFSFELPQKVVDWEPMGDYRTFSSENGRSDEKTRIDFIAPSAMILSVDDNPMNLVVFSNLIKHNRVQIDTASSGDEAIRLSAEKKYDMIFLDHMMPDKDGIETLRELKSMEDNPNISTPAICLTANAISGAKEHYISEGFDDYLSKPIDPVLLEKSLLNHLPKEKIEIVDHAGRSVQSSTETGEVDALMKLRADGCLNVDTGLKNNGTSDAYISILKMYYSAINDRSAELNGYYRSKDLSSYAILIHSLKSSSRIIGAMELGEMAQKLENAAKVEDAGYLSLHHEEFMSEYLGLKEKLCNALGEDEKEGAAKAEKPIADADMMNKVYNDIKSAAEDMDSDRLDELFARMDEYSVPDEEKAFFKKLRENADNFDYSAVADALSEKG